MTTEVSLYDRLGGSAAIRPVTEAFYHKVLSDESLARIDPAVPRITVAG
jgi:truncated hemoglobin YjbI